MKYTNKFILIFALALFAFLASCDDGKNDRNNQQPTDDRTTQVSFPLEKLPGGWNDYKTTAGGVNVYSVVPIPDKILPVIESAITLRLKVFTRLYPGWNQHLSLTDYEVWMLKPDGITPESKLPYLQIGGVMSAGTIGTGTRPVIIVPHFQDIEWSREADFFDFIYNEDEHLTEFVNRNNVPSRFVMFTGAGDVHKHDEIPDDLAPRGLLKRRALPADFSKIFVVPTISVTAPSY